MFGNVAFSEVPFSSFAGGTVYLVAVSELSVATDTQSGVATFLAVSSSNVVAITAQGVAFSALAAMSEVATTLSAANPTVTFAVNTQDVTSAASVFVGALTVAGGVSDTVVGSDAYSPYGVSEVVLVESAMTQDTSETTYSAYPSVVEGVSVLATTGVSASVLSDLQDTATSAGSSVGYLAVSRAVVEMSTALQSAVGAVTIFSTALDDSAVAASETTTTYAIASTVMASAVGAGASETSTGVFSQVDDATTANETLSTTVSVFVVQGEDATAADGQAVYAIFQVAISDLITATAGHAAVPTYPTYAADSVVAQDSETTTTQNHGVLVADAVTGAVSTGTMTTIQALRAEDVTVLAVQATNADVNSNIDAQATGDAVGASEVNFVVKVSDLATIFDQTGGRRLWELVPDSQDPNWVMVSTTLT